MLTLNHLAQDECRKLNSPIYGVGLRQIYDTIYQMMFWQSLGLPPPDIGQVILAGTAVVSTLFVGTFGWFCVFGVGQSDREYDF